MIHAATCLSIRIWLIKADAEIELYFEYRVPAAVGC